MGPLLACSGLTVRDDGSVAGAILVNGSNGEPPLGGPWISQLFRHPGARGAGVPLLRRALAVATRDGVPAIGLAVTDGNPAQRLYEAHGFVESSTRSPSSSRKREGPAGPSHSGHRSPLNYYVPGLESVCLGGVTLLTAWTGRRPGGRRVATAGSARAPVVKWAIRRTTEASGI